jgi:hypothetical protein
MNEESASERWGRRNMMGLMAGTALSLPVWIVIIAVLVAVL